MESLIEKFEIPITEWKTVDAGKNKIRIRGVALRGDVVSRNNRQYVARELKKATNTWIGKPITINHDDHRIVGHLTWMDYDEPANLLMYEGEVNRQPYVDMLRSKSAQIRGMSIQAGYLYNQCYKCGEKFYDEESFRQHMYDDHFIKINPKSQPHGIVGEALSLVLSPEIPGYDGTTIELMEMQRAVTLRLLETVIKEEKLKEQYKMKKTDMIKAPVTVVPRAEHAMSRVAEIKEQEDHGCGENEHWDEEKQACVANEPAQPEAAEQEETPAPKPPCPEGWHEVDGECVKNEASEQEESPEEKPPCPEGQHRDSTGECVPDEEVTEQEEPIAVASPKTVDEVPSEEEPEDEEPINPAEEAPVDVPIVTVPVPPEEEVVLEGYKIPKPLRLGEPFAGYTDFDDCVSKNPDKDDPDAYCADIMRKVEGEGAAEMKLTENLYDSQRTLADAVKTVDKNGYIHEIRLSENLNRVSDILKVAEKNELKIMDYLNKREKAVNKALQETVISINKAFKSLPKNDGWKRIKPYNDKVLREKIAAIKPYDDSELRGKIAAVKPYDDKPLLERLEELQRKLDEKDALVEKVAGERNKLIEKQQEEIATAHRLLMKKEDETEKILETVRVIKENYEDSVKAKFKGKHVKETEGGKNSKDIPTGKSPLEA